VPHPEGGFFRETWRSGGVPMASKGQTDPAGRCVTTGRTPPERNELTSIFYMTAQGGLQYWAKNASDHVHYWHGGGAYEYLVLHPGGRLERQVLGPRLDAGEVLQFAVPGGCWKAARVVRGAFCLLGEAVAPGFDFRDFTWLTEAELRGICPPALWPELKGFLHPDQRRDFDRFYNNNA